MPGININDTGASMNGTMNGLNRTPAVKTKGPAAVEVTPARLQKLSDPSLFISDAFIDGRWEQKDSTFNVVVATILCLENGKTFAEAEGEILYAASFTSWFAEEATRSYGDTIPSSTANTTVMTVMQPIGVCGIITPWNFPAAMITRKVGPALAAGCACVIKPPSETPHTYLALTKLAIEVGIDGNSAAMELVENPLVKKISFTGSTPVGKLLSRAAAGTIKKMSLELGGNAPFIIFDDADLALAVDGVMLSKFRCFGQTCVCANRILVQENVIEEFTDHLVAKVRALKMACGFDEDVTQGPLVNRAATDKVAAHVKDAVERGAKVYISGSAPLNGGFFFEPTVMTGVTSEMLVAKDETFGPLAPIFSFKTEDEAVAISNDTEFSLAGYFFS
ncbi:hypothetical protein W97_07759 [Coniosporium apollinis CBS 100218]|uniref:Succinate-semialdehyde dehydrogenase, mitochondrial n=1 Tax=Coniosporium apollinis (strain CBS 100218) TaxID=1168221 RepID=R7Z2L6_CONA1|nr:uncharacterized protein W97_07759 [Coniosporium apollinis CBS 100218]EON68435.1 hypothetical protein W97_07759 [Coniosporium apollinis CBS 100218]